MSADADQINPEVVRQKKNVKIALLFITLTYLFFEFSFNAWLLNTVGGGGSESDVSNLEIYGRTLSGIALALFVCQGFISLYHKITKRPVGFIPVFVVGIRTVLIAYQGLNAFVNKGLIETSTPLERKQYASFVVLQRALVDGKAEIKGLSDDGMLFKTAEGRSFLAIFPYLVSSIDGIETDVFKAKLQVVENQIKEKITAKDYYDIYKEAMVTTLGKWKDYSKAGNFDIDGEIQKQQRTAWSDYSKSLAKHGWTPDTVPADTSIGDEVVKQQKKAWNEYVRDLADHGWMPSTVPAFAKDKVVAKVRQKLDVPSNWKPTDRPTFMDAVDHRVRREYAKQDGKTARGSVVAEVRKKVNVPLTWDPSDKQTFDAVVADKVKLEVNKKVGVVKVKGHVIPPNLSFDNFVLNQQIQEEVHEGINKKAQDKLHEKIDIWPADITIKPHYADENEFKAKAYNLAMDKLAEAKVKEYDSPSETFAINGVNGKAGIDAARASIVPPVALFFSLIGATLHSAKLLFIVLALLGAPAVMCLISSAAVPVCFATFLYFQQNGITKTDMYKIVEERLMSTKTSDGRSSSQWVKVVLMHEIAVGQTFIYPICETFRKTIAR
jgi:hypothetical protein